jgi:DNA-binding NtrC family response regulator
VVEPELSPQEIFGSLVGQDVKIRRLFALLADIADTAATVIIEGETGTGKELVAEEIHRHSDRKNGPFVVFDCGAVPRDLIESALFGHVKGAFTGAVSDRPGAFAEAHGGTILLDEISEISPHVQAKLLRVLQERELERVGGSRTIKVDVRVIATTNRDLEQSVERKEFRQDLYFRLNVVPIFVPPLRERREDIVFLAEQFAQRFERKHGVKVAGLSPACRAALEAHPWPGNVRELQNVIERAVILCSDGEQLQPVHLGFSGNPASGAASAAAATTGIAGDKTTGPVATEELLSLGELEKRHILLTLDKCGGNRTHAARKLGISIRTLRNKLNEYGLGSKAEGESEEPAETGVTAS